MKSWAKANVVIVPEVVITKVAIIVDVPHVVIATGRGKTKLKNNKATF